MPKCYVALGGNLGSVADTFQEALALLQAAEVSVKKVSSCLTTEPVGERAGGKYVNAAAEISTTLEPLPLLDLLQSVEQALGRVRTLRRGPRTLDLDLLFYGGELIESPRLTVPHPACWRRRFVLDPLVEIAPELFHREKRLTVRELRERLLIRPLRLALTGGEPRCREDLLVALKTRFPEVRISEWPANPPANTPRLPFHEVRASAPPNEQPEPTLLVWLGPSDPSQPPYSTFRKLPRVPRLDASHPEGNPIDFLTDVLQGALG